MFTSVFLPLWWIWGVFRFYWTNSAAKFAENSSFWGKKPLILWKLWKNDAKNAFFLEIENSRCKMCRKKHFQNKNDLFLVRTVNKNRRWNAATCFRYEMILAQKLPLIRLKSFFLGAIGQKLPFVRRKVATFQMVEKGRKKAVYLNSLRVLKISYNEMQWYADKLNP